MENEIVVQGKKINLEILSDVQIVDLFKNLTKQELQIDSKIIMLEKAIAKLEKSI